MTPSKRVGILVGGLAGLLVVAVAFQFVFQLGRQPSAEKLPADTIPAEVSGAVVKELDIGGTELMNRALEQGLGFSDYRYREYKFAGKDLTIYLGYWQDRKRHFMDLGTHAPDNCWVSGGWKMDPKLPKQSFQLDDGRKTWPAESRTFHAGGSDIHVVYWHLLNGEPLDYTRYGTGKTVGYLLDNISHYWSGTGEQYFLRVSSSRPIEEIENDPVFKAVIKSLAANIPLVAKK